jgi:hypothetical protein
VASGFSRTNDMRVTGILLVLAIARVAMLAGHDLEWSWWSPSAYLWHDAAIALLFALAERRLRRAPPIAWTVYAIVVAYIGINVPVTRVLSTPLTWTMWRAAGGALSDSILMYVTMANMLWIGAIAAAAGVIPWTSHHKGHQGHKGQAVQGFPVVAANMTPSLIHHQRHEGQALQDFSFVSFVSFVVGKRNAFARATNLALVALGPIAAARVDTHGLERNAWSALIVSAIPRLSAEASSADWRLPRAAPAPDDGLTRFRGIAARRNVILVSLESTAAQYLGLYGAVPDVAPNLSALAESAIVFDNAYAVYPESIKGLLSTLCSVYPAFDRAVESAARGPCRSIASKLAAAGYRTALFHSGRFAYLGMDAVVRGRGYDVLADAGDIGGNHESSFGVDDRSTVDRLLTWIDAVPRSAPFFVTYLPIAGHHPYEVPYSGPFPNVDEFGRYRNALRYGDDVLGRLVAALRARGLESNTVWLLMGDHGEAFGQHDGNFGHTFQVYEENVHVPFVLAAPGAIAHQIRSSRVVSTLDAAPTLLDFLGLAPEPSHQGRSVFDDRPRMALFFADYSLGLLGLRDGPWKYIYELESGRSRLFDVGRDPQEAHNLAEDDPGAARWYQQRLRQWSAAQKTDAR